MVTKDNKYAKNEFCDSYTDDILLAYDFGEECKNVVFKNDDRKIIAYKVSTISKIYE